MRHIDAHDIEKILKPEATIQVVADAMKTLSKGATRQLPRGILDLGEGRFFGSMTGSLWTSVDGRLTVFGSKLVSVYPENFARGRSSHQGLIILFDALNGQPLLSLDAASITALRTAAASAVATHALARPDAKRLTLLGYGEQAYTHALAIQAIRPLEEVVIWGRDPEKARALADKLGPLMLAKISTAPDVKSAIDGADIVCCVTSAKRPILFGQDLAPGMHLNLVGSSFLGPVEVDDEVVRRSRFIVDSEESARAQAAEFANALASGVIEPSHMAGEIGEVLLGQLVGRQEETEITVYKSLGHIVQDLAAATFVCQQLDT
ncbi:MAG TPA: ornithine cyclodeaminase family protein [Wenzhouxiangella sp.]